MGVAMAVNSWLMQKFDWKKQHLPIRHITMRGPQTKQDVDTSPHPYKRQIYKPNDAGVF
jgi:hypothetical protein